MNSFNRRDLCLALPAFALFSETLSNTDALAQAVPIPSATKIKTPEALDHNSVFHYDQLPVKKSPSGEGRAVTHGTLPTGEGVELHNTILLAGHEPHPPHQHMHEEFLLVREGQLEWLVNGKQVKAGPGDILYARSMELHGLHNVGTTQASYFVVAIGPNLKTT